MSWYISGRNYPYWDNLNLHWISAVVLSVSHSVSLSLAFAVLFHFLSVILLQKVSFHLPLVYFFFPGNCSVTLKYMVNVLILPFYLLSLMSFCLLNIVILPLPALHLYLRSRSMLIIISVCIPSFSPSFLSSIRIFIFVSSNILFCPYLRLCVFVLILNCYLDFPLQSVS